MAEVNSNTEPTAQMIDAHKISYTYDAEDKVTAISYALVENGDVSGLQFTYNSNRWLTKVSAAVKGSNGSKTVREYSYDTQGKVAQIKEYPAFATDGTVCITKDYTYNELDQVESMVYKKGTSVLESYHYEYDKNGNIIEKTEINNTPTTAADRVNETKEYTYDTLGRLTETVITDHTDNDSEKTISYEYDKVGNRTKMTEENVVTTYTYNELDQLLETDKRLENEVQEFRIYTYDENGNQIKEGVLNLTDPVEINYSYDAENRLNQVVHASVMDENAAAVVVQENLYNGDGQRIQKKEGEDVTNYFYQDGAVSYTTKGTSDTKVIQNLLGLEGNVITAETISDCNSYFLYNKDIQGSTSSILNESGSWELSYEYSDFGETLEHGTSNLENEICYTGGIYDDTTQLYYLNARYYEPVTGRFLTEDTYRGEIESLEDWHLYVYCNNNPINYVDPSGHKYSPSKAAKYAYTWGMKYNPIYPNYSAGNKDCTNFVSQCVYEGGKKMKKPKNIEKQKQYMKTTKYWYCIDVSEWHGNYLSKKWKVSTSWTSVKDFYSYWNNKKGESKIIICDSVKKLQNKAKKGDVVQLYSKKRGWYHSIIISKGTKGKFKYAGHSNPHKEKTLNYLKQGESEKYRIIRIM